MLVGVEQVPRPPGGGGKLRTFSCSTEESGVESLSPAETRCGSEHSEQSTHHSEAESETSDYPRSTPSPSAPKPSNGILSALVKNSIPSGRTKSLDVAEKAPIVPPSRRITLPTDSWKPLQNLKVSLVKLSTSTLQAHHLPSNIEPESSLCEPKTGNHETKRSLDSAEETKIKRLKLEDNPEVKGESSTSQKTQKSLNFSEPGFNLKSEPDLKPENETYFSELKPISNLPTSTEDLKLEIAKIDSILDGSPDKCHVAPPRESVLYDPLNPGVRLKNEIYALKDRTGEESKTDVDSNRTNEQEEEEEGSKVPEREFVKCLWKGCGLDVEDMHLLEHLNSEHLAEKKGGQEKGKGGGEKVKGGGKGEGGGGGGRSKRKGGSEKNEVEEKGKDGMECLWVGCKVYGAKSSAKDWLKKHITSHIGSKPFRCILDSCRMKFSSQISLSRHVNSHFKPPQTPASGAACRRSLESTPIKFYIRKTRRKARLRPTPLVNNIDLFDVGTMAGVKDGLSKVKRKSRNCLNHDEIKFDGSGSCVVFTGRVIGRKLDGEGSIDLLVEWHPLGLLGEEWVPEQNFRSRRKVLINQLSPPAREKIEDYIFGKKEIRKSPRKALPSPGPRRLT